ncbi:peptide/nickel transport system permease protein [Kibdelosporangium banguiense]|uniref:Peptide/nickel transport system permease protein n=1 Tax=Kibdelosporangium banguiense TaxID=1365924 RepID=A0ABS4TPX5_9PSEU|nr:ABC transporter permease [Kibdelosporangium banguiense]MBP2326455.1 peptide/nickel transport system permease protein [Kibdelosporangium banguiense]
MATSVVGAVGTVLAASFVVFAALGFAPGDPVAQILGQKATEAERVAMRAQLGLDKPLLVRYWDWLTGVLHGDFGLSLTYRQDVTLLLGPRVSATLVLVAMSAVITLVVGVLLGTVGGVSARWRPLVNGLAGLGTAVPGFVAAVLLISVFAVGLGWFPTYGAGNGFGDQLWHLALPAVALSMAWAAYIAQITTASVTEEAGKEHVATAIGRGLPRLLVIRRHVLRNAFIPVLTVSGLMVGGLVAGSVVVENAFGIDGLGSLLVKGVLNKDYAVVNAVSLIIVVVFVVVTTVVDLVHTALDPRLRERT